MNTKLNEIKEQLRKKAVIFETGGIRPTNQIGESWIGKVCWQNLWESQPVGKQGNPMIPIATIFVEDSEYIPRALKDIRMINIFMDEDFWNNIGSEDYIDYFKINTYESLEGLVPCNYTSNEITPFPLIPYFVDNEFPMFDDIDDDIYDIIIEMEELEGIDYHTDLFEDNRCCHKIGGYPATIQGGVGYDDGYEFVLQIASDEKAGMNIIDGGNFYFGYNPSSKSWSIRCDFY